LWLEQEVGRFFGLRGVGEVEGRGNEDGSQDGGIFHLPLEAMGDGVARESDDGAVGNTVALFVTEVLDADVGDRQNSVLTELEQVQG
jgi:hypothetical protein